MIKIPAQKMYTPPSRRAKAKNKLNNLVFVNDKIINRKTEPTLYNIESAKSTINNTTRVSSTIHEKKFSRRVDPNQNTAAMEVLFGMNISIVDMAVDHSLLESNDEENLILNPNIVDMQQMRLTMNKNILATDKFPNSNDPIYQLDDADFSNAKYVRNKIGDIDASNIDVSKVVSDITIINMKTNGTGINKYLNG
tara:strand:+ start:2583 stop:3167 length:585 start_codon:yes stop_codon:yes gene_type:complete